MIDSLRHPTVSRGDLSVGQRKPGSDACSHHVQVVRRKLREVLVGLETRAVSIANNTLHCTEGLSVSQANSSRFRKPFGAAHSS